MRQSLMHLKMYQKYIYRYKQQYKNISIYILIHKQTKKINNTYNNNTDDENKENNITVY